MFACRMVTQLGKYNENGIVENLRPVGVRMIVGADFICVRL